MADEAEQSLLVLTADIVAAHVSNNMVPLGEVGGLIERVHGTLSRLGETPAEPEPELRPAVPVRSSVKPDHIVCLEDGKRFKMLRRHLATDHDMTPAEYRARWKLAPDYPLVAPNYAQTRRDLAVKIGLGRKREVKKPAPRGRPRKA